MMWDGDGGGWIWGAVMMTTFVALLVALVWGVLRASMSSAPRGGRKQDAAEILRERFARGEIDEEEFDRRTRTLERSDS